LKIVQIALCMLRRCAKTAVSTAVRDAVGPTYPVSVKLNSSDFQKGGFTVEESAVVAKWLDEAGVDLLEISGGNYESPAMMGIGAVKESTVKREAYFVEFAGQITKEVKTAALMITGGFRSKNMMESVITDGTCQMIGIGRPLCGDPACSRKLLSGEIDAIPDYENTLDLPWYLAPLRCFKMGDLIRFGGQQSWYYKNLVNFGSKKPVEPWSPLSTLNFLDTHDGAQATKLEGLDCVGSHLNASK